jgi:hypothetical protein
MKAINAVYNILSNNAALTAVVGSNINPLRIVQGVAYPGITIRVSSVTPHPSKTGYSLTDWATVEINIFATTYTQAVEISELVRNAMEVDPAQVFNQVFVWLVEYTGESHMSDDNAEEYGVYNIIQDYTVSYNRVAVLESFLLLEDSQFILLETGDKIIL